MDTAFPACTVFKHFVNPKLLKSIRYGDIYLFCANQMTGYILMHIWIKHPPRAVFFFKLKFFCPGNYFFPTKSIYGFFCLPFKNQLIHFFYRKGPFLFRSRTKGVLCVSWNKKCLFATKPSWLYQMGIMRTWAINHSRDQKQVAKECFVIHSGDNGGIFGRCCFYNNFN